ncbi:MAG TPA: erythromycin esterase family protein, partial [Thermoanaerobaculia bacterium]
SLAPLTAQGPEIEAARPPAGYPVQPGVWQLLHGNDPTRPLDDLEPLRALIGKASVVGLGETIHTSGGYYRMKHRVFRFLVEKMGFRVFAFESPWENAEKVARYVAGCSGSAGDAVSQGLFGVWASEEVRELAQWMCDWNRTHRNAKDRLHFFGFDIQQPKQDGPALIAFLARIGIPGDDPAAEGIRQCEGVERDLFPEIPEEVHARCMDALAWIESHFARNAKTILRQTSKADFEWAKVRRVGLRGWQSQMFYPDSRSYTGRDEAMAYTFQVIRKLRHPRAKIAVWAHNSHVSHAPHPLNGGIPMGMFLTQALGRSYVNLGLAAREVSIDWPGGLGCGPQPLGPNAAEEVFHGVGQGDLLIDTDAPLLQPGAVYTLGARRMVPQQHFDGVLYLEESPKMTPLRWEPCQ